MSRLKHRLSAIEADGGIVRVSRKHCRNARMIGKAVEIGSIDEIVRNDIGIRDRIAVKIRRNARDEIGVQIRL